MGNLQTKDDNGSASCASVTPSTSSREESVVSTDEFEFDWKLQEVREKVVCGTFLPSSSTGNNGPAFVSFVPDEEASGSNDGREEVESSSNEEGMMEQTTCRLSPLSRIKDNKNSDDTASTVSVSRKLDSFLNRFKDRRDSTRSSSWLSFSSAQSLASTSSSSSEECIEEMSSDCSQPVPESVIDNKKELWIVTTAALPWFTGTAVNPLLRAAYFARQRRKLTLESGGVSIDEETKSDDRALRTNVHLVVPWLDLESDRVELYGEDWRHATKNTQRKYMLQWLQKEFTNQQQGDDDEVWEEYLTLIQIHFYAARYHAEYGSIFPMVDICEKLPDCSKDAICILEEPEHLNYYRAPSVSWRQKFSHVVGVIHTNYPYYAAHKDAARNKTSSINIGSSSDKNNTTILSGSLEMISAWMVQSYCDKVIKLSAALPVYAASKEVVSAVHGIRNEFLHVGEAYRQQELDVTKSFSEANKIYFIGKLLWAKGLDKLLHLQEYYKEKTGKYFAMDVYGSGPDREEIEQQYLNRLSPIPAAFKGRTDHTSLGCTHRIFVNPSESEVLCTTTAEAIAMNKFVIIPNHPSNTFFTQFPNCLSYQTDEEFVAKLDFALTHSPEPLSTEHQRLLTWESAIERFIEAAVMSEQEATKRRQSGILQQEYRLAALHRLLGSGRAADVLRTVCGAGPCARQYEYEALKDQGRKREIFESKKSQKQVALAR